MKMFVYRIVDFMNIFPLFQTKAGQERFRSVTHAYYRDAHGELIRKIFYEFIYYFIIMILLASSNRKTFGVFSFLWLYCFNFMLAGLRQK